MIIHYIKSTIIYLISVSLAFGQVHPKKSGSQYDPTLVVVKLKNHGVNEQKHHIGALNAILKTKGYEKFYPPARKTKRQDHPLSNIYKIRLNHGQKVSEIIDQLLEYGNVEYAEPYYLAKPFYIPNDPHADPNAGNQTYLDVIKAYDAWGIEKGDSSIIIGIIDTGTDLDHEDLEANIFINEDDPVNGVDDDADGLIDNYYGYDFADDDHIPEADNDDHGVEVSGISNARTDNGTGIAGIGFHNKFMPLKIFKSFDNSFNMGYEAVAFAADHGCKVINLSWGGNDYSQAAQDIINYAVLEKDAVVIAAAGNTNDELDFYPASYDNVLSVGAADMEDRKANWATYSINIDLVAPGEDIFTTRTNDGYSTDFGSSFAAPMVSGTASLLRNKYPELTAVQVMEKIRVTTDSIYHITENQEFVGKLGKGRLNVFKALTDSITPSVRMIDFNIDNGFGSYAFHGDTVEIIMDFVNYLHSTTSLSIQLLSSSPYVEIIENSFTAGVVNTLDTIDNQTSPFVIRLNDNTPPDQEILFELKYEDGSYYDFQFFKLNTSPDYITLENQTTAITVSGNGNLGYHKDGYDQGVGINYLNEIILDHIGVILAQSSTKVSSSAVYDLANNIRDHDFKTELPVKLFNNSEADIDARSVFIEVPDHSDPIHVKVEQKILSWEDVDDDFFILEYRIINTGSTTINNLYTGILGDWNLSNKNLNKANWDGDRNLGYVYDASNNNLFAGMGLLTTQNPIYNALDIGNENGNTADVGTIITKSDKFTLISGGISNITAGSSGDGNDVAHILGGEILSLAPNNHIKIAIAISAAGSLSDLQSKIDSADVLYQGYLHNPPLAYTFFGCKNEPAIIDPPGVYYDFYSDPEISNLLHSGETYTTSNVTELQKYYLVNRDSAYESDIMQVHVLPQIPVADFTMLPDTILLDETGNDIVHFTDSSFLATEWSWDFDNGYGSTVQNPEFNFPDTGNYNIKLSITSDLGCRDSLVKTLVVKNRSPRADVEDQEICYGDSVLLSSTNATDLKYYSDSTLNNLLHQGKEFKTGPILSDTSFFITNNELGNESLPAKIHVYLNTPTPEFSYDPDSTDISSANTLILKDITFQSIYRSWEINNSFASEDSIVQLDYSTLDSIQVQLKVQNTMGCFDSLNSNIEIKESPTPEVSDRFETCKGVTITIKPENGQFFIFYEDGELTHILHKGSQFTLNTGDSVRSIFITNIDSLGESLPVEVIIDPGNLEADFSMDPDTLDLRFGNLVQFTDKSTEAVYWNWDFDNGKSSTLQNPSSAFIDPGTYSIKLKTSDVNGCTDSIAKQLIVEQITGIENEVVAPFKVYPNPSNGYFKIQNKNKNPAIVRIIDTSGRLIKEITLNPGSDNYEKTVFIPQPGLYLIIYKDQSNIWFKKIIVSP